MDAPSGRKLSALRHLYRYLLLDKLIQHDPTLNIDSPKQWKVLPSRSPAMRWKSFFAQTGRPQRGNTAEPWHCVIVPCSKCFTPERYACRKLSPSNLKDLKLDLGYVLVRGKGDKERIVPLGKSAQEIACHVHEAGTSIAGRGSVPRRCYFSDGERASLLVSAYGKWFAPRHPPWDATPARTCCATVAPLTW